MEHDDKDMDTLIAFIEVLEAFDATLCTSFVNVDGKKVWQITVAYSATKPGGPKSGAAYKAQGYSLRDCFAYATMHLAQLTLERLGEFNASQAQKN